MAFRFLHTADWHLGRVFHQVSLIEDQAHVLAQVLAIARDTRVDALIIAGDVYDRAVPPTDAVRLLDETLHQLALELAIPVIIIAGNHDSAGRLGFGATLMAERQCHIRGPLSAALTPIRLGDADGPVLIYPLPYAEPVLVRECLGDAGIDSHDGAMAALTARITATCPGPRPDVRTIAVAHCFVTGGGASESERPLSVGGAGEVAAARLAGFNYCALGHLHRPQAISERIAYSGSLLKYSFSEVGHQKSVTLVELAADGAVHSERIALSPRRDLRVVDGLLDDLLAGPGAGESAEDYLLFRLHDKSALLDPLARLRAVYPNALHMEHPGLGTGMLANAGRARLRASEQALFASFFEQVTGDPLDPAQQAVLAEAIDAVQAAARA